MIANWDRVTSPVERAGLEYADLVARAAEDAFLAGDPEAATDLAGRAIALVDPAIEPLVSGVLHERLARYVRETPQHEDALGLVLRALDLIPEQPPSVDRARGTRRRWPAT